MGNKEKLLSFDLFAGGLQHLYKVVILHRLIIKNLLINRHQNVAHPREVRGVVKKINGDRLAIESGR